MVDTGKASPKYFLLLAQPRQISLNIIMNLDPPACPLPVGPSAPGVSSILGISPSWLAGQIGNPFTFLIGLAGHWGGVYGRVSSGREELSLEDEPGVSRASCRRLGRKGQASSCPGSYCPCHWPHMSSFTNLIAHRPQSSKRRWVIGDCCSRPRSCRHFAERNPNRKGRGVSSGAQCGGRWVFDWRKGFAALKAWLDFYPVSRGTGEQRLACGKGLGSLSLLRPPWVRGCRHPRETWSAVRLRGSGLAAGWEGIRRPFSGTGALAGTTWPSAVIRTREVSGSVYLMDIGARGRGVWARQRGAGVGGVSFQRVLSGAAQSGRLW